jgi:hypothetical protein
MRDSASKNAGLRQVVIAVHGIIEAGADVRSTDFRDQVFLKP